MNELHNTQYLPLISHIESLLAQMEFVTVAIDGNCAAGKTWLASFVASCLDCNVIHMDDFFLPSQLRTKQRLQEAGGNIHYERFLMEVIHPLLAHKPLSFRRYNCKIMDYLDHSTLPVKPLTVIEGAYCMRPEFQKAYDCKLFLTCSEDKQLSRISLRNGEEMLPEFVQKWIPMENQYFEYFQIAESCDQIFIT